METGVQVKKLLFATALTTVGFATAANAGAVFVSTMDDIFLAGQPSAAAGTDGNYFQTSPTGVGVGGAGNLPVEIGVTPGETISLSAATLARTGCGIGCNNNLGTANGDTEFGSETIGGPFSVTSYTGYPLGLMGVYGDPPGGAPLLIGNSKTLLIPAGVTELYLGTVDAFAGGPYGGYAGTYNDNVGGWNVQLFRRRRHGR
jgi:hypothetical protein